jgi:hypothetical protein
MTRQRGISLIVTLLITVLLSLLALYGAGVLVLDTRSAANDFRAREAMIAAESGAEQGVGLLSANRARVTDSGLDIDNNGAIGAGEGWTTCTSSAAPCLPIRSGDRTNWRYINVTSLASQPTFGGTFTLYLLTPASGDSSLKVYNIVSTGLSADSNVTSPTTATVKQGAYLYPLLLGNVTTPIAAVSSIPLSGNYTIITNPDGGGKNVPVSAWSKNAITPGGSFQSCYESTCAAPDGLITPGGKDSGEDMIANDPNFPDDLFKFLFGVENTDYQQIKNQATIVTNCSTQLTSASSGLIWVTDTSCNPGGDVGTAAAPVLLVGDVGSGGKITINANDDFYGLLFMFSPGTPPTSGELKTNGTAHLHGAVFAYDDLKLNGNFILEYDGTVLATLKNNASSRTLARISGSWTDVQ